jgi:hypothetical protein
VTQTHIPDGAAEAELGAPCPFCGTTRTHRRQRKGFVEKYIRAFLGSFPWRCATCNRNFYFRKRSRRRSKKEYVKS